VFRESGFPRASISPYKNLLSFFLHAKNQIAAVAGSSHNLTFTGHQAEQKSAADISIRSSSTSIHIEPKSSHLEYLTRVKLGKRKRSSTIIVPRDDPRVEIQKGEKTFDPDDARAMSPGRNNEDLEKMCQDAREELSLLIYLRFF
jgi:hypothetical protein